MYNKKSKSGFAMIMAFVLFVAILIVLTISTAGLSASAADEDTAITKKAIERAAVLCYASEGFYPPSLTYIEDNYGVQVDDDKFIVYYEVFASNVMPVIRVLKK